MERDTVFGFSLPPVKVPDFDYEARCAICDPDYPVSGEVALFPNKPLEVVVKLKQPVDIDWLLYGCLGL